MFLQKRVPTPDGATAQEQRAFHSSTLSLKLVSFQVETSNFFCILLHQLANIFAIDYKVFEEWKKV